MAEVSPKDQSADSTLGPGVLAGGSLGLLIGFLVGFSVASTVGGVLSALVALLATALGLSSATRLSNTRLSAFCFAMLIATPIAVTARSHDWLGAPHEAVVPLLAAVKEWTDAGYAPDEARQIVRAARVDAKPTLAALQASKKAGSDAGPIDPARGVLYSGAADSCSELNWGRSETVVTRLAHIGSSGPPLDDLVRFVRALPEGARVDTLRRLEDALCHP